jgi:hypothetical protein
MTRVAVETGAKEAAVQMDGASGCSDAGLQRKYVRERYLGGRKLLLRHSDKSLVLSLQNSGIGALLTVGHVADAHMKDDLICRCKWEAFENVNGEAADGGSPDRVTREKRFDVIFINNRGQKPRNNPKRTIGKDENMTTL